MKQKLALVLLVAFSVSLLAQNKPSSRLEGLKRNDGFVPFYWDEAKGTLLFELSPSAMDREFLYFVAMGSEIGRASCRERV